MHRLGHLLSNLLALPLLDGDGAGAGSGAGAGGGSGAAGGTGGAGAGAGSGSGGQGGTGGQGAPSGGAATSGGTGSSGDGWTPPDKATWDNTQRQLREFGGELQKLKDADAERQRKADEEAGNFRAIAEREQKARQAAEQKAAQLEAERKTEVRERRVERLARRLNFRDPADVLHRVPTDALDDDGAVERALKKIAEEKPYLVDGGGQPRTRDLGGGDANEGGSGGGGQAGGAGDSATGVDRMARAYAATNKT